jgi:hypothetical protein
VCGGVCVCAGMWLCSERKPPAAACPEGLEQPHELRRQAELLLCFQCVFGGRMLMLAGSNSTIPHPTANELTRTGLQNHIAAQQQNWTRSCSLDCWTTVVAMCGICSCAFLNITD